LIAFTIKAQSVRNSRIPRGLHERSFLQIKRPRFGQYRQPNGEITKADTRKIKHIWQKPILHLDRPNLLLGAAGFAIASGVSALAKAAHAAILDSPEILTRGSLDQLATASHAHLL
jgi:hypothetical protein